MTVKKIALLSTGWILVVVGPVIGVIPGPGGIAVTGGGAMIILSQSLIAKRVFLRAYKRYPQTVGPVRRFVQRRKHRKQAETNSE
ncbi:MAG: hypothetical protein ACE363_11595 [Alphaproteobacteria bacterium]